MNRATVLLCVAVLAGVTVTGMAVQNNWLAPASATPSASSSGSSAALPTVRAARGSLIARNEFQGVVTHGESWALPIHAAGLVTEAPAVGQVISPGEELLRIDNRPVYLAQGSMPLYRTLALSATRGDRLRGVDVAQLQRFLALSGAQGATDVTADGVFGPSTHKAVRSWQGAVGLPRTGAVEATDLVFAASAVRVAGVDRVGATFSALTVTDDVPTIQLSLSGRDRSLLADGDAVTVITATEEVSGVVASVSMTIGNDGQRGSTVTVLPEGELDADLGEVVVMAERELASDAVLVPASALVALSDGGYAVELADTTPTLVRVEIGAVLDGQVEVTSGLRAGQVVVVAP